MSPRQQAFSNHEKASEEKEQLFELIRMHPCICNLKSKAYKETGKHYGSQSARHSTKRMIVSV